MATAATELLAGEWVVARAVARFRLRAQRQADDADTAGDSTPTDETLAALEAEMRAEAASPLARLERIFALDARELDYVEACLAFDADPSIGRLLALLAGDAQRPYPTEPLLARLYGHGLHRVIIPESPLARWRLVRADPVAAGEPAVVTLDPLVRDWLVDQRRLDEVLVGRARLTPPREPLSRWTVDEACDWIRDVVTNGGHARLHVVGSPGSGRRTFAACVAERFGLPLLAVSSDGIPDETWSDLVLAATRQAFLDGCALAWYGDDAAERRWPALPALFPIQFLVREVGAASPLPGAIDRTIELPSLEVAERAAMWRLHVPHAAEWESDDLLPLAAHHRLTPGEIAAIGARRPSTTADAARFVREGSRHRLGELAQWVESPFAWDDLVTPASIRDALEDLVYEARNRATFWEQPAARRLFPQGRGLFALFTGNPGTGKTMAAQVVAAALGLDLFRISLATVVSKYVGETAKNLQRTLARAEEMDAVLLFDEADALFGKRTEIKDAHDRFANTDTNYLLQAIEAYRGVALLASNKKANIDPAFTRRLRWVLEFPRPDAAQRRTLWVRLLSELAGESSCAALASRLDVVADTIEVTGAQIKYAILTALFAARRDGGELAPRHLVRGLERELMKEGRALSDRDRGRIGDA
jgi:ATP-dependent 26S proteasome regulatory subunit